MNIFEKFFSKESKKDSFAIEKEKSALFLSRETGNQDHRKESPMDDNIREIVIKMNRLPFLYTIQSCGGHVRTREAILASYPNSKLEDLNLPPVNRARYRAGGIHFETKRDNESQIFINGLKELIAQFEEVELFDPSTEENPDRKKLPYMLNFGESSGRRSIDIQQARELETRREEFKSELGKLIEEFLQK